MGEKMPRDGESELAAIGKVLTAAPLLPLPDQESLHARAAVLRRQRRRRRALGGLVAVLLACLVFGRIALSGPDVSTTVTDGGVTTPPDTASGACAASDPADVAAIQALLVGNATRLRDAFTIDNGADRYVAAGLDSADGQPLSTFDVWLRRDGRWYSVSGNAQKLSTAPNAEGLPGLPNTGGAVAERMQRCMAHFLPEGQRGPATTRLTTGG